MNAVAAPTAAAPAGAAATATTTRRTVHGACPHDCPDTCAIRVTVETSAAAADGAAPVERIVEWHGHPDHAPTHGALCTKVSRYPERLAHPERVLTPLKRVGPKGAGRFEPVSWEAALADIAARLHAIRQRDPEAIVPYSYAGTMGMIQGEGMATRFFNRLGASRLDRTICASAGGAGLAATYGGKIGMKAEHFAESRLILIWGSNSIASNLHFWTTAQAAKRHGARLIAIDPRRTETAEKCHQHIALLPGTDGALALGIMHELIVHDWLDHDYIEQHIAPETPEAPGWPSLRAEALQWPPERVAEVCGLDVAEVRDLARDYATATPAAIRLNYGMQRARGGGNATRLIALLPCLTGAWRHRAGGLLMSASGWAAMAKNPAALDRTDLLPAGRVGLPRLLNMSAIGDALLSPASPAFGPRVEAVIVYNSNPVAVAPESPKVVAGFAREDLFTVVLEHFLTDTADHADYVLPATMQPEHFDVHTSYGHTDVLVNEAALAPAGQARPNTQIFRDLAAALAQLDPGFDHPAFHDSDEDLARQLLSGGPVDLDALRAQGWFSLPVPDAPFAEGGFPLPGGRARIGVPGLGLPRFVPPYESVQSAPALAARYPLAMISPPARHFLNTTFVNVKSLRDIEAEPVLEMHPDDAAPRGIADGQPVRVFNDRGSYHCTARVGARARAGVVNGLGIWWRKLGSHGTNVNELTHQHLTDLGAAAAFYDVLVEVEPAPVPAPTSAAA